MNTIGKELVKLRESKGLTAKEVAIATGTSQSYICKVETGNVKNPRKETIIRLLSGINLNESEQKEFLQTFYNKGKEIKKENRTLIVKKERPKSIEDETLIFQFKNRSQLSLELSAISCSLMESAKSLINRTMLDVRYDAIKLNVNQCLDRLEIFKINYELYVEKLIKEHNLEKNNE